VHKVEGTLDSPSVNHTFILQPEESPLDLDHYVLKVENMDISYINPLVR